MTKIICSIYHSGKKPGTYLYVEKAKGLSLVPKNLLGLFGRPKHAMTLLLTEERTLASVDAVKVIQGIQKQGYFLQMPPPPEVYMAEITEKNSKLY